MSAGRYSLRLARSAADMEALEVLRHQAFFGCAGHDRDAFDAHCTHVLIEEAGAAVAAFRLLHLESGADIARSYSAQFYDLTRLERFEGAIVELGRFCTHPARRGDADILRTAWAGLTRYVDARGVEMLIGCASFEGQDPAPYVDAFGWLKARHSAPSAWRPVKKAPQAYDFGAKNSEAPSLSQAMAVMPPLLRSYLAMGAWVSDHAVIDAQMDTLHVFTAVEIAAIPAPRKRLLRAAASALGEGPLDGSGGAG